MNTNICTECGTENEEEYTFCKNCGAKLKEKEAPNASHTSQGSGTGYNNVPPYNQYRYGPNGPFYTEFIDGIASDEVAVFVGAKANTVMPKFAKMELTGSKVSWCWPAAILSFLFGPLGAALWFLYRKMYKIGLILLSVGIVMTAVVGAMTYETNSKVMSEFFEVFTASDYETSLDDLDEIGTETTPLDLAADLIEETVNTATLIITGLFGYYLYKKDCVSKIRSFKTSQPDSRYYRIGLASIGGVSGGMLALGIIAMIIISNISSYITFFASFF